MQQKLARKGKTCSTEIIDLIVKLLSYKKHERLGIDEDAEEILSHDFFSTFDDAVNIKPKSIVQIE